MHKKRGLPKKIREQTLAEAYCYFTAVLKAQNDKLDSIIDQMNLPVRVHTLERRR